MMKINESLQWQSFSLLLKLPQETLDMGFFRGPVPKVSARCLLKNIQSEIALRFKGEINQVGVIPALYPLLQLTNDQCALMNKFKHLIGQQGMRSNDEGIVFDLEAAATPFKQRGIDLLPSDVFQQAEFTGLFVLPIFCKAKSKTDKLISDYFEEFAEYRSAMMVVSPLERLFQIPKLDECDFLSNEELTVTSDSRLKNQHLSTLLMHTHAQNELKLPLVTSNKLALYYDGNNNNTVDMVLFSFNTFSMQALSKSPEELYVAYANYVQDFVYYKCLLAYKLGMKVRIHVGHDLHLRWLLSKEYKIFINWIEQNIPIEDVYRETISKLSDISGRPSEFIVTPQSVALMTNNYEEIIAYSVYAKTMNGDCLHLENIYCIASDIPEEHLHVLKKEAAQYGCQIKMNQNHGVLIQNAMMVGLQNNPSITSPSTFVH